MAATTSELQNGGDLSREGMLSAFDRARNVDDVDAIIDRLLPHERARFQDIEDQAAEQAGRITGRTSRGYASAQNALVAQRQRSQRAEAITLAQLMMDATYRALHETAIETLHDAERAIDDAIMQLTAARADLLAEIETVEANALRTAEGKIVFQDGDQYRYADGSVVDDEAAASVVPRDGVEYLTYTQYQAMNDRADDMDHRIEELADMRDTRLLEIRDELTDNTSPAKADRVRDLTGELDSIVEQATSAENDNGYAPSTLESSPIERPDVSSNALPVMPS